MRIWCTIKAMFLYFLVLPGDLLFLPVVLVIRLLWGFSISRWTHKRNTATGETVFCGYEWYLELYPHSWLARRWYTNGRDSFVLGHTIVFHSLSYLNEKGPLEILVVLSKLRRSIEQFESVYVYLWFLFIISGFINALFIFGIKCEIWVTIIVVCLLVAFAPVGTWSCKFVNWLRT